MGEAARRHGHKAREGGTERGWEEGGGWGRPGALGPRGWQGAGRGGGGKAGPGRCACAGPGMRGGAGLEAGRALGRRPEGRGPGSRRGGDCACVLVRGRVPWVLQAPGIELSGGG